MTEDPANNSIVPIGKYKGMPLERLMADQPYADWLLAQSWFLDRYADMAQLLRMGRLNEPQDTPEHNAMVAGLIDRRDEFEAMFAAIFQGEPYHWYFSEFHQVVEPKGGDLLVSFEYRCGLLVEVKPLIGDDYPTVIRQVKAGAHGYEGTPPRPIVIARKVEPTNLTLDQVRRQFDLAGVKLILECEFFAAAEPWRVARRAHLAQELPETQQELAEAERALVAADEAVLSADPVSWSAKHDAERKRTDLLLSVSSLRAEMERLNNLASRQSG